MVNMDQNFVETLLIFTSHRKIKRRNHTREGAKHQLCLDQAIKAHILNYILK